MAIALASMATKSRDNNNNNSKPKKSLLDRLLQFGLIAGIILLIVLVIGVAVIGYYVLPTVIDIAESAGGFLGGILDPSGEPTLGEIGVSLIFPPYAIYALGSRVLDIF